MLLHNKEALSSWKRSPGRLIARADVNWPGLMARSGSSPVPKVLINKTEENLALQGYDAVAYFKQNEAVVGHPQYTAVHEVCCTRCCLWLCTPSRINHKFRRRFCTAWAQHAHSAQHWRACARTNPKTTHHLKHHMQRANSCHALKFGEWV